MSGIALGSISEHGCPEAAQLLELLSKNAIEQSRKGSAGVRYHPPVDQLFMSVQPLLSSVRRVPGAMITPACSWSHDYTSVLASHSLFDYWVHVQCMSVSKAFGSCNTRLVYLIVFPIMSAQKCP